MVCFRLILKMSTINNGCILAYKPNYYTQNKKGSFNGGRNHITLVTYKGKYSCHRYPEKLCMMVQHLYPPYCNRSDGGNYWPTFILAKNKTKVRTVVKNAVFNSII